MAITCKSFCDKLFKCRTSLPQSCNQYSVVSDGGEKDDDDDDGDGSGDDGDEDDDGDGYQWWWL